MKLITSNNGKYDEYREMFEKYGFNIIFEKMKYPELQADTLEEVVEFSGNYLKNLGYDDFIIDDSGIFINALNGFPGVYSAYVQKTLGNNGILKLMKGISDREAVFVTVIGYFNGNERKIIRGEVKGEISDEVKGSMGFGYDPIFIPKGYNRTFAEMTISEKNSISHRSVAFKKLINTLMKKEI